MLTTRWHSLFSLTITTFFIILIIHISPVIADSRLPFSSPNNNYFAQNTASGNNSLATVKQQPSSWLQKLNLTSKQKEQIEQIHHQYKHQIQKKRKNLTVLQKQLSDLMVGTESAELIRAKNKQLVNLRQEIGELRFESMLATREILTPQQREKFKEIMESQLSN